MLLGTLVQTIVLLFITLRTDWEKQVSWLTVCLVLYLAMLFAIFIDNTLTGRRLRDILNYSFIPICRWWLLKRDWRDGTWKRTEDCRALGAILEPALQSGPLWVHKKNIWSALEIPWQTHIFSVLTISGTKWGDFSLSRKCVHFLKPSNEIHCQQ